VTASSQSEAVRWHLRHCDQVVHGPYSLKQLIDAAKAGHLAPDSQIRHPVSTRDQWVLANSIPSIAEFCPRLPSEDTSTATTTSISPAPRVSIVPRRKRAKQGRHLISTCLQAAVPLLVLLIPAVVLYRSPDLLGRLMSGDTDTAVPLQEPRIEPRANAARRAAQSARAAPSRRAEPVTPRPPIHDEPAVAMEAGKREQPAPLIKPRTLADLLTTPEQPVDSDAIRLKLELDSQKWIALLEVIDESTPLAIASVSPSPTSTKVNPTSGELSFDRPTRISFVNMSGLAIDLRLDHVGSESKLAVVGDWVIQFRGDTETPFSLARLKNRQKAVAKQLNIATTQLNTLLAEKNERQAFLDARGNKRLDSVNVATNRIKWIDSQLPAFQAQAKLEQEAAQRFLAFAGNVQQLHDDGELVLRPIDDEHSDH
jgi:hypothetical protein